MLLTCSLHAQTRYDYTQMQAERLDRGVVAFRSSTDSVVVTWRYLPTDPQDVRFEVLCDGKLIATTDARHATFISTYLPPEKGATYEVRATGGKGKIKETKGLWTLAADAPIGYLNLPLNRPEPATGENGRPVRYVANDATVADLDGYGQLEIILKWDPSDSKDNSQSGMTSPTLFDAYKLDGRQLWRINLGRNIRSGAHYTQFLVADFDGDGRAELLCKTSDGTIDGTGRVLGDASADYRVGLDTTNYHANGNVGEQFRGPGWPNNMRPGTRRGGFIKGGNEWVTAFDGRTGAAICSADYIPAQGNISDWGDNYANRSERYLAATAYLDGKHLSAVFCRGYYTRTVLAAYDFDGKMLTSRWVFDSNTPEWHSYAGQGNHNLRVADVDGDGRDEITYGSMAVDDDGRGLYNTRMGHGDAMHLMSFFPNDDALQVWDCHENKRDGSDFRDARTGKVIFQIPSNNDVGRCMAADIDPENPGLEMWSSASGGICNTRGEVIDPSARIPVNFGIWWDGDLLREMLDHETVSKYKPVQRLAHFDDCSFNNGTKSNPCLCADILGDWREEVIVRTSENDALRIYLTPINTPYRFHTFLADPVYRHSVTMQNIAYNQPTCVGFYFGAELEGSGREFRGWKF